MGLDNHEPQKLWKKDTFGKEARESKKFCPLHLPPSKVVSREQGREVPSRPTRYGALPTHNFQIQSTESVENSNVYESSVV
jgi:hypothetical protein